MRAALSNWKAFSFCSSMCCGSLIWPESGQNLEDSFSLEAKKSCRIVFASLNYVVAYFKTFPYSWKLICFYSACPQSNVFSFFFFLFLTSLNLIFITDIPLLPSISSLSAVDDEEPGGPFTVHWLNNKELHFTLAMEVFLQQLRGSLEQRNSGCSHEGTEKYFDEALNI